MQLVCSDDNGGSIHGEMTGAAGLDAQHFLTLRQRVEGSQRDAYNRHVAQLGMTLQVETAADAVGLGGLDLDKSGK